MKPLLIIFITLSLILGVGYWTLSTVSRTSDILLSHSRQLKDNINDRLWETALEKLEQLKSSWAETKSVWTILLNHTEIDNIDMSLVKIEQYIKARETGLALAEISSLELLIGHIPEKERLTFKNLF